MSVAHTNSNIQRKDDLKNNGCDSHSISPLFRMHEKKSLAAGFFILLLDSSYFSILILVPIPRSVKNELVFKTSQVFLI